MKRTTSSALAILAAAALLGPFSPFGRAPAWGLLGCIDGDVNGDGALNIGDPILLLNHLFLGGDPPVACAAAPAPASVAVIVRHAEKLDAAGDPGLSAEGKVRAERLALALSVAKIDVLIASDLLRTRETLQPLADARSLPIVEIDDDDPGGVVARIRALAAGEVAVVSHHSYTIPTILRDLGVEGSDTIDVSGKSYDNLLVLIFPPGGKTQLLHLKY
jgi:phosphohistidine phosphatase SixA